jgi:hypothetical protein
MVAMNWKERVCAEFCGAVPEFLPLGLRKHEESPRLGGGINSGASQHEEERNAEGMSQNAGCVLVLISVISLG